MRRLLPAALLGLALTVSACLDEPELEERWTLLTLGAPRTDDTVDPADFTVTGEVIYRSIIAGGVVADVRVSDTLAPGELALDADGDRMVLMSEVNTILANSVSAGLGVEIVAGWNRLIHDVSLTVNADPALLGTGTVYLVFYLADVEEEIIDNEEVLVVTPLDFAATEVLPVAIELDSGAGP